MKFTSNVNSQTVNVAAILEEGRREHLGGRFDSAETLYRQVLAYEPNHAEAMRLLGTVAAQTGQLETALDLISRAIRLDPADASAFDSLGSTLQGLGRETEAIAAYRNALKLNPRFVIARCNLACVWLARGDVAAAIEELRAAVEIQPDSALAWHTLSHALMASGEYKEAVVASQRVLHFAPESAEAFNLMGLAFAALGNHGDALAAFENALRRAPENADWHFNRGNALRACGRTTEAMHAYEEALQRQPLHVQARTHLGNLLHEAGRHDEAILAFREALRHKPDYALAWNNLGNALQAQRQYVEAQAAYREAIRLDASYAEAYSNLGNALQAVGQRAEAMAMYQKALTCNPQNASAYNNLGLALLEAGRTSEALEACRQALRLDGNLAEAYNNIAGCYRDEGKLDLCIAHYRKACELKPGAADFHSNLVYTLHFHSAPTLSEILEEAVRWDRRHGAKMKRFFRSHSNSRDAGRRLRVGYVSPYFRSHPVGHNLLPLLQHHDHTRFEIYCYSDVVVPDFITEACMASADHWRKIISLRDEEVAEAIRTDGIDLLIDLTLHMAHNRLRTFACKPAPVQATYLAYAGTSGLETMDYRLSDIYLDPEGSEKIGYSEKTMRLPRSYWCYQPAGAAPETRPRADACTGPLTFGCLNNFSKVSSEALDLWAAILADIPDSTLVLHAPPSATCRGEVTERFAGKGVASHRIRYVPRQNWSDYLRTMEEIDIALDTFPYAGGITTCDALWMGTPVVTLSGHTAVGRGGRSILSNVSFPEWIASTPEQYKAIATALAENVSWRAELRSSLRAQMERSPLRDPVERTRDLEVAYREMWQAWCGQKQE